MVGQADGWRDRQTDRELTDKQANSWTGRQAGRQTGLTQFAEPTHQDPEGHQVGLFNVGPLPGHDR